MNQAKILRTIKPTAPAEAFLLQFLWKGFSTQMFIGRLDIGSISSEYGLPQGAPSSPTLFNEGVRDVLQRMIFEGHGIKVGIYKIPGAAFADD